MQNALLRSWNIASLPVPVPAPVPVPVPVPVPDESESSDEPDIGEYHTINKHLLWQLSMSQCVIASSQDNSNA